jgi:hypothetical protein
MRGECLEMVGGPEPAPDLIGFLGQRLEIRPGTPGRHLASPALGPAAAEDLSFGVLATERIQIVKPHRRHVNRRSRRVRSRQKGVAPLFLENTGEKGVRPLFPIALGRRR